MLINIDSFVNQIPLAKKKAKTKIEDKWVESKFNNLIADVTKSYESHKFHEAVQKLESFVINDLSRTYIQMIRERSDEVFDTLNHIRMGVIKMYAPVMPLLGETMWQEFAKKNLVKEESIHLSDWPKVEAKKIDKKLEEQFEKVLKIIEMGMAARDEEKIGLRWPLAKLEISADFTLNEELEEIIARQLNVKKVQFKKGKELKVKLDTKMTPELEAEGFAREFARKVQAERKNAGLRKGDMIKLKVKTDKKIKEMLGMNIHFLLERTNSDKIDFVDDKLPGKQFDFEIKGKRISASFS
jgi:isoleucyl-tRNA synthetase